MRKSGSITGRSIVVVRVFMGTQKQTALDKQVMEIAGTTAQPVSDVSDMAEECRESPCWKVLIVDDDESVHGMTRLVLNDLVFRERGLEFFSAYSAEQAREIMAANPDMALVLLDVILEGVHAGLDLVDYIRHALNNQAVQLILRTGQPGRIPEESVILNYDVNGYKDKAEITYQRLLGLTIAALRSCERIHALEASHRALLARNASLEKELARAQGAVG